MTVGLEMQSVSVSVMCLCAFECRLRFLFRFLPLVFGEFSFGFEISFNEIICGEEYSLWFRKNIIEKMNRWGDKVGRYDMRVEISLVRCSTMDRITVMSA